MRLIFNIFVNDIGSHLIPNTPYEIAVTPQLMRPKLLPQFRVFLISSRDAFNHLHSLGWRIARWRFDKHMHMISQYLHNIDTKLILLCYLLQDFFHTFSELIIKDVFPIFGYPYQMILKIIDNTLRTSDSNAVFYNSYGITLSRAWIALRLGRFDPPNKLGGIQRNYLKNTCHRD